MRGVTTGTLGPLHYFAVGSGPPFVVLPGLSASNEPATGVQLWFEVQSLKALAKYRTVYNVNRKVGLAPDASIADIANDYADALRTKFDGPVDVMGISTGGSVVQQFAIDHPELVAHLVLASTACRLGPTGKDLQLRLLDHAEKNDLRGGYRELSSAIFEKPIAKTIAGWTAMLLAPVMFGRPKDLSDMKVTLRAEDVFDVESQLGRIQAPTLLVGGERDPFYSPELFRTTAAGIPGAQLHLVEGKGHVGAISGKEFVHAVEAFLAAPV
jgi:pimeloyl-ACP methyl ester carboxylesterase